jgi:hypothetical protein
MPHLQLLAAMAAHSNALAAAEALVLDPSDPVAARADDHHVADVDRHRLVHDAALLDLRGTVVLHRLARLGMSLGDVDARDHHRQPVYWNRPSSPAFVAGAGISQNAIHLAALAGILAVQHDDGVAGPDLRNLVGRVPLAAPSQHLRRERNDLHVVAVAQLSGHGAKDARAPRVALVVDQDRRVLVEADVAAVRCGRIPWRSGRSPPERHRPS